MAETSTPAAKTAPGPAGHLLAGNLRAFKKDPLRFLMDLRRDYGDVVRIQVGPLLAHLVSHPDAIRYVLATHAENYHKAKVGGRSPVVGEGLLTSEGDFWREQRKLAEPAFRLAQINAFAATMGEATEAMLAGWRDHAASGRPLDVAQEMGRLTLTVLLRTLFGTDVGENIEQVGPALGVVLQHTSPTQRVSLIRLPDSFPTRGNLQFRHALATLDKVVYGLIAERRRRGKADNDLLSMLVFARDEETGETMTDKQIRDDVMTFFIAGHETTATALSWTWYLLSKHPAVERQLQTELTEVLGGRAPTAADMPKLRYTLMVLREAMRLYPPAWMMARRAVADDEVAGYRVPAGSILVMSQYVTHRHPEFWENPEGFDPERFAAHPSPAYFPFGGGPRVCIGNNFALLEARLVIATVAQRYRLELVPGHPVEPEPLVTLRPRHGLLMTLRPRSPAATGEAGATPVAGAS